MFDWKSRLNNIDVNEQVSVYNEAIISILSNFVSNEIITSAERDSFWINQYIKNLTIAKNYFDKRFVLPSSNIYPHFLLKIYKIK